METVMKVLRFLRLVDSDSTLSLTSIALMVVLAKIVLAPSLNLPELGTLFLGLLSYQGKKVINAMSVSSELSENVAALGQATSAVDSKLKAIHERMQVVENRTSPMRR